MAGSRTGFAEKMKAAGFVHCNIVLPIILGAIFYYVFCPETLFVRVLDDYLPFSYHARLNMDITAVRILRFYLMDFLWAYSLAFLVSTCLKENNKTAFMILLLFELFMEFLQLHPLVKGSFDLWDLAVEVCADIFAIGIQKMHYKNI